MSDLQHERIAALAAELRLGALANHYGAIAQEAANAEDVSYADFLERVLRAERDARRVRSAEMLTRTAGFPAIKTIGDYDFGFATGAPKAQIQELVRVQLGMVEAPESEDAADALAVALCHHMKKIEAARLERAQ